MMSDPSPPRPASGEPERSGLHEHVPLTPVAFEILLALAAAERHGYAIMRRVEDRTEGRLSLHPGTLYRALGRLADSGWIEELDERPDPERDDERRRYYRITELGRAVAEAEARRLEGQLGAAREAGLVPRTP